MDRSIFLVPDDPLDEINVLNYLKSEDKLLTDRIAKSLTEKKDIDLWAKRKRYYIIFIATQTDLPNHFVKYYLGADQQNEDESVLSRSTSIKGDKVEEGMHEMSTYLK
jgi:hypothetical protein